MGSADIRTLFQGLGTNDSQSNGLIDLNVPPVCSGFVPLPWEEGNA